MTARTSSTFTLLEGKCEEVLATMPSESVDSIVTDAPYELGFMGKAWDGSGIAYSVEMWREALRVLKPGGYLLAFGGTRTYHRMAVAIEDAGFTIRDSIHWLYGSGFPKSLNISKELDRVAGAERQVIGTGSAGYQASISKARVEQGYRENETRATNTFDITAPATEAAILWDGYGTALKPAHEPIVVAQKPLCGTYAANVLAWGVGALNIDGCRVGDEVRFNAPAGNKAGGSSLMMSAYGMPQDATGREAIGRWPSNLVLTHSADCGEECASDCPVALLDAQSGTTTSKAGGVTTNALGRMNDDAWQPQVLPRTGHSDSGGASRFYPTFRYEADDLAPFLYCAKPSKAERNAGLSGLAVATAGEATGRKEGSDGLKSPRAGAGRTSGGANTHPTVKPIGLMRWLVRLVTPHGGTTLDLFAGSGTTVAAAIREGKQAIGIEMTPEYWPIIRARAAHHERIAADEADKAARQAVQASIFDDYPAMAEVVERVEGRCWTCRGVFVCERDRQTGEIACHACQGERHRAHYAAWLARQEVTEEGEDDGIDF